MASLTSQSATYPTCLHFLKLRYCLTGFSILVIDIRVVVNLIQVLVSEVNLTNLGFSLVLVLVRHALSFALFLP